MQYRNFRSPDGRTWRVWLMQPAQVLGERRQTPDRRRVRAEDLLDPPLLERRRSPERRVGDPGRTRRTALPAAWQHGWLVFETDGGPAAGSRLQDDPLERRRLAPVPTDWERCPEPELAALCERATRASRSSDAPAPASAIRQPR